MSPLIRILTIVAVSCAPLALSAANPIYTYIGLAGSAGYSKVSYSDWGGSTMNDYSASGMSYSSNILFQLYAPMIIGEFSMGYQFNKTNSSNTSFNCTDFSSKLKYRYIISQTVSLNAGPGLYFNTPPASKTFDTSGGALVALGAAFDVGFEWKISTDAYCSYGNYGVGHNGRRLAFGGTIGVLHKFGKF